MRILRGHKGKVLCAAFSPSGDLLATGSGDPNIKLWHPATGKETGTLTGHEVAIWGLAFSPDGKLLASAGADGSVRLWDLLRRAQASRLSYDPGCVWRSVGFSPDGRTLAASCERAPADESPTVSLWDVSTRRLIRTVTLENQSGWGLAFAPNGQTLVIATSHCGAVLHDVGTGEQRMWATGRAARAVAFLPEGRRFAMAEGWTVGLVDVEDLGGVDYLEGHQGLVQCLAVSSDGSTILSGGKDEAVCVWEAATGRLRDRFDWEIGSIHGVALAPDGMKAAACGSKRAVMVWDLG